MKTIETQKEDEIILEYEKFQREILKYKNRNYLEIESKFYFFFSKYSNELSYNLINNMEFTKANLIYNKNLVLLNLIFQQLFNQGFSDENYIRIFQEIENLENNPIMNDFHEILVKNNSKEEKFKLESSPNNFFFMKLLRQYILSLNNISVINFLREDFQNALKICVKCLKICVIVKNYSLLTHFHLSIVQLNCSFLFKQISKQKSNDSKLLLEKAEILINRSLLNLEILRKKSKSNKNKQKNVENSNELLCIFE